MDGLPEAHERLRRVEIWNTGACEFIKKLDSPETMFYCDPPYLHETRVSVDAYEYEMSVEDHVDLLAELAECDGKFMLSGYRSELYDEFAENCDWWRHDIDIFGRHRYHSLLRTTILLAWLKKPRTPAGRRYMAYTKHPNYD